MSDWSGHYETVSWWSGPDRNRGLQALLSREQKLFSFYASFHFVCGSMFLMRRFPLTRHCASSPDSSLSDKSFLVLSNHFRFGLPLLLFHDTSIAIIIYPHSILLFSQLAHTTHTETPIPSSSSSVHPDCIICVIFASKSPLSAKGDARY